MGGCVVIAVGFALLGVAVAISLLVRAARERAQRSRRGAPITIAPAPRCTVAPAIVVVDRTHERRHGDDVAGRWS